MNSYLPQTSHPLQEFSGTVSLWHDRLALDNKDILSLPILWEIIVRHQRQEALLFETELLGGLDNKE
jgi:hypothetical protein